MAEQATDAGELVNLLVEDERAQKLKLEAQDMPEWTLTDRQLCDLELLMNGGFSPLIGFMNKDDYESVCKDMRLSDGSLWPMPITLDVDEKFAQSLSEGDRIALRDEEGVAIAVLSVGDVWQPDKSTEAEQVFGADDQAHPAVNYLHNQAGSHYVGGAVEGLTLPHYYDFKELRWTPHQLREQFKRQGWTKVVAFQTRNPMHRAHVELALRASRDVEANLLIHPAVGMTKPGDVDHYTRVRVYKEVVEKFPSSTAMVSLLPLAMRMGGPREALWHAMIRKNYGATHFIVGRDHAGPGKTSDDEDFYGPYDAQQLVKKHQDEIGIEMVPFKMMVYVPKLDMYKPIDELEEDEDHKSISGTQLRSMLRAGSDLPEWFTYPEVARELRRSHRPRRKQGFTVFFTGLSGSGKSTLAKGLHAKMSEQGGRSITLLDGDVVRQNLSSGLGFSKADRDTNVRRIGYVASEISKHSGIAICAPIAPYDKTRRDIREMIESQGSGFVLVHVATPLEVCEQRDRKGLYAAARAGKIDNFTGISDPYEEPADADLVFETVDRTPEEIVQDILLKLEHEGFVGRQD